MQKIWQKSAQSNTSDIAKIVEKFTVGDDYILDQKVLPYDLKASKAHAQMLHQIKIISKEELEALEKGLAEIKTLWKKGEFEISRTDEDCHTAIEKYLTEKFGTVGEKIHTGRSRNDQILVAMRLLQKHSLQSFTEQIEGLLQSFTEQTEKFGKIKMPGYTHMQRAMPSSVGMWLGSFEASFKDNFQLMQSTQAVIDQNPLGSAAGFGENTFGLDREFTSKKLGFAKTQTNPMYCAYSRGKFEKIILDNLGNFMLDFGKFASDLLLFTTKEFGFFALPDEFLTGSSIMPQKKNYDVLELMRGKTSVFFGYQSQIQEIIKNLPSGYNRDFQLIKAPFLKALQTFGNCLEMTNLVVNNLQPNQAKLEEACSQELYATDEAYKLVKNGISFREAYKKIGAKYI